MDAIMTHIDRCGVCHERFAFDPRKVPALEGKAICRTCMEAVNNVRVKEGRNPLPYDESAYLR